MGRGRAKAKQTRVARDLKYRDVGTDLTQLQRELQKDGVHTTSNGHSAEAPSQQDDDADDDELYAKYADDDDDDDFDSEDDGGSVRSHHRRG
ncbi:hypothetical protein ABIA35_000212 [Catenulispora sp. MAP12-49]|jgi:hypothetical protein|uniref:DUF3073 domain-containing protein n=1 Tax=unclassified Catenulispora TaxID=414885 RepID=UPI0035152FE0